MLPLDPPHPLHSHALIPDEIVRRRVKAELRKRTRGLRKTAPLEACRARSALIVEALSAMPAIAAARSVALFWPIEERHEVDLRPLDERLRVRGVRLAYPAIDPETRQMTFRFVADPAALAEQGSGFLEPDPSSPAAAPGELDAIVVPAIVLAPSGHRIGYGAGYYDRTLPAFAPPAVTVGVGYDYQLLAEVPVTEGDVAVAWIVTDKRTMLAG